ncbi:MAG: hypothetical protein FJ264_01930 [Planctomycetes bacterium]|nr:hypothetical protein [Planctomycetota bacterium]
MRDICTDNASKELNNNTLQRLSLLKSFQPLLEGLHSHADCHNKKLYYDQYISLMLLCFFNPALTGLRLIQQASTIESVQKKLGIKRTNLGSLSEASHVFDPRFLIATINELGENISALKCDHQFKKWDLHFLLPLMVHSSKQCQRFSGHYDLTRIIVQQKCI